MEEELLQGLLDNLPLINIKRNLGFLLISFKESRYSCKWKTTMLDSGTWTFPAVTF